MSRASAQTGFKPAFKAARQGSAMPASSKPLVFLIHGMGVFAAGWEAPFVQALDDAIKQFGYTAVPVAGGSIKDAIDLQPITYSGRFTDLMASWETHAQQLIDAATPAQKPQVQKAIGWLTTSGIATKDPFVWTHVMDVFLWVTSPMLRNVIKNDVALALTSNVVARRNDDPMVNTSFVCHSLGTAVAEQTLQDLAAGNWQGGVNGFAPSWFHFNSLHTVANVSKLLEFDPAHYSIYDGLVRPGPYGDANSYALYFYDYRHELDPFTLPRPFAPSAWPAELFDSQPLKHVHQIDVHALEHFLMNPAVHIRMLRSWFGFNCITSDQELAAIHNFLQVSLPAGSAPQQILTDLNDLADKVKTAVGTSPDLVSILTGIAVARTSLGQLTSPAPAAAPKPVAAGAVPKAGL
jgi:hypothetical protein